MGICQSKEGVITSCLVPPKCIASGGFGCIVNVKDTNTERFIDYLREKVSYINVYNGDEAATSSISGKQLLSKSIVDTSGFLEYIKSNVPSFKIMFIRQVNTNAKKNKDFNEKGFIGEVTEATRVTRILENDETTIKSLEFSNEIETQDKYFAINIGLQTPISFILDSNTNVTSNIYLICQDYCVEGDLIGLINSKKITLSEIKKIYTDLAPVLSKLHANDFIHNDIKLENIVKCGDKYKFIDFGWSCNVDNCKNNSGTPSYRLPRLSGGYYHDLMIKLNNNIIPDEYKFPTSDVSLNTSMLATYANGISGTGDKLKDIRDKFKKNDEFGLAVTLFLCLHFCKKDEDDQTKQIFQYIFDLCNPSKFLTFKTKENGTTESTSGGASNPKNTRYEKRTKKELLQLAKERKLAVPKKATKEQVIALLRGPKKVTSKV
jgi:serine/threonine protein kinase